MPLATPYDKGLKLSAAGRHFEAIECFEQALAAAPSDTRILFALGNTARALGQPGMAQQFFSRILALEPGRIEALVNLANLLRAGGQFAAARSLLEPALARSPDSPELHLTLGSAWREEGDNDRAAACYRAALAARPHYAPALSNLADLLADDGDIEGARTLYGQAIKADPGNAQARLNRAVLHLLTGNLKEGWRDYAARLEVPGKVPASEQRLAAWAGGPLKKIRLLVRSEQGVGDQIMFASLFGELADAGGGRGRQRPDRMRAQAGRSFRPFLSRRFGPARRVEKRGRRHGRRIWLAEVRGRRQCRHSDGVACRAICARILAHFPADHAYLKADLGRAGALARRLCGLGRFPGHRPVLAQRQKRRPPRRAICPAGGLGEFHSRPAGHLVSAQYDAGAEEIAELERLSAAARSSCRRVWTRRMNWIAAAPCCQRWMCWSARPPRCPGWAPARACATLKILYDTSWTGFGQGFEPFAPSCQLIMPQSRGDWANAFAKARGIIAQL